MSYLTVPLALQRAAYFLTTAGRVPLAVPEGAARYSIEVRSSCWQVAVIYDRRAYVVEVADTNHAAFDTEAALLDWAPALTRWVQATLAGPLPVDRNVRIDIEDDEPVTCTVAQFLDANDDEHEAIGWLCSLDRNVGDRQTFGGGAAPLYTLCFLG